MKGNDLGKLGRRSGAVGITDLGHEIVVAADDGVDVIAQDLLKFRDVSLVRNGGLVKIRPMLAQPADDVVPRIVTAEGLPDHQCLRVVLLLVPSCLLLSSILVLGRHAALRLLKLQGGKSPWILLSDNRNCCEQRNSQSRQKRSQSHLSSAFR